MHILSCCTNQKNVLQIEIIYQTFEVYLLTGEPRYWFLLIESLKITFARSYGSLIFSQTEGLNCFLQPKVLPKLSKITDLPRISKNKQEGSILVFPKSAKWLSIWNCSKSKKWPIWKYIYISSHGETKNFKFGQQVNLSQRLPLALHLRR